MPSTMEICLIKYFFSEKSIMIFNFLLAFALKVLDFVIIYGIINLYGTAYYYKPYMINKENYDRQSNSTDYRLWHSEC